MGGEVPLITLNTPELSVLYFFPRFTFCPELSWNCAENKTVGQLFQFPLAGKDMISALDPELRNK